MKHMTILTIGILCLFHNQITAGMFTPHLEIGIDGGATQSYLVTTGQMNSLLAPTSGIEKPITPAFTTTCNLHLGRYLGITSGLGYRHFGQSTSPTTVYLKDDIFEHDFESFVNLHYLTVPVILKAGLRKNSFSLFLRAGVVPSLLVSSENVWMIDDRTVTSGSSRKPNVSFNRSDIPIQFGGEAGVYFGKNGLFLVCEYNYGINDVANGISGHVSVRSYGVTLQYRRVIF